LVEQEMKMLEEQSKLWKKISLICISKKKNIQDEEQHIEQQFLQTAEQQQEVVLVMEEEMEKLEDQSKLCKQKKFDIYS